MGLAEIRGVTPLVEGWLIKQGFYPRAKVDGREGADIEAEKQGYLWVVEAKGFQKNAGAFRNAWFAGLGQLAVARCRYPDATVSLALTWNDEDSRQDAAAGIAEIAQNLAHLSDPVQFGIDGETYQLDREIGQTICGAIMYPATRFLRDRLHELKSHKDENVRKAAAAGEAEIASENSKEDR